METSTPTDRIADLFDRIDVGLRAPEPHRIAKSLACDLFDLACLIREEMPAGEPRSTVLALVNAVRVTVEHAETMMLPGARSGDPDTIDSFLRSASLVLYRASGAYLYR